MRNEKEYIGHCLKSVVEQDYCNDLVEIIVVDGGSIDGSVEIVEKYMKEHSGIRLMGGPGVNCPAAMNIGIKNSNGGLISKVDAHGYVASDFLKMSAKHLCNEENIKCVGGPIIPVPKTIIAKANALARSSFFGVGKGVYSMGDKPQFVDTVQCGVYKKDIFNEIGLFDELLQFGEDEEINWRIRKRGYRIFSSPEIRFFYFPRNSFGKLFQQYSNYGILRAKVVWKHPDFFKIKHIIPTTFVFVLFVAAIFATFSSLFTKVFIGIVLLYVGVSLACSTVISAKEGWRYLGLLPISFAALHFGYGIGLVRGIVELCLHKRVPTSGSK
jgi:glycosyltransferase involved in cell wall biosynthesis